jgi:hypothetical protein
VIARSGPAAVRGDEVARLYLRWAAVCLAATVLSGVWLRTAFLEPGALAGFAFRNLVHAHSHLAFFGWATPALFALVVRTAALPTVTGARWLRLHAHAVGMGSLLAFAGFLTGGYTTATIALSTVHVGLWVMFAFGMWPRLDAAPELPRRAQRGALAFLVLAGLGAMAPGVVMARGIADPWIGQLALQSFLTPFIGGWLMLGAMGAAYMALPAMRLAAPAMLLVAAGTVPSLLLHVTAPHPAAWLTWVGQAGTVLVGAGTLLFAADLLRSAGVPPLLRLAGFAAAGKGALELGGGAGVLLGLVHVHALTVAYLHLVLLALVTPALLCGAMGIAGGARRTVVLGGALAVMLGAIAVGGLAPAANLFSAVGIEPRAVLLAALTGAAMAAAAVLALLADAPLLGAGRRVATTRPPSTLGPVPPLVKASESTRTPA